MAPEACVPDSVALLKRLIAIPSLSRHEGEVASFLQESLEVHFPGQVQRLGHNIIVDIRGASGGPTLLFCTHLDTVAPTDGWTRHPFAAEVEGERIYGLGSNDAGASAVAMIAAARNLRTPRAGRLLVCLAAEEEAGSDGFRKIEAVLPRYDDAIFGEPTGMGMATSMRGAMRAVLRSHGVAGHASRPWEGRNAADQFAENLRQLRALDLKDGSPWGTATIEPTAIHGGNSPNQLPDLIEATLDIRTTTHKDNDWIIAQLKQLGLDVEITVNLRRPIVSEPHSRVVKAVRQANPSVVDYVFHGSCDMAFATAPSVVMGPGGSERSHVADEFITVSEIAEAIAVYTAVGKCYFA